MTDTPPPARPPTSRLIHPRSAPDEAPPGKAALDEAPPGNAGSDRTAPGAGPRVPDVNPFAIDPLFMRWAVAANVPTGWFVFGMSVLMVLGLTVAAGSSGLLLRADGTPRLWADLSAFLSRDASGEPAHRLPLLRDYPSLVLAFTVVVAVSLVYALFRVATRFHTEMSRAGSIVLPPQGAVALTGAIDRLNDRYRWFGRWVSPFAFAGALAFMVVVNLGLRRTLFQFLGPDLYQNWWASLQPLRPGGVAFVVFGAWGIYAVYVEAVLGITYVTFLRDMRDSYRFRANPLNPDGFFGWQPLRVVFTNLQLGAACTFLNSLAFTFFLEPALGPVGMAAFIAVFVGIVSYVYVFFSRNLRRHVREDKSRQTRQVVARIEGLSARTDERGLLELLVAYRQLDYLAQIPSSPIRQRWLVAGAISLLGTVWATLIQLLPYLDSINVI